MSRAIQVIVLVVVLVVVIVVVLFVCLCLIGWFFLVCVCGGEGVCFYVFL